MERQSKFRIYKEINKKLSLKGTKIQYITNARQQGLFKYI